MVMMVVVVVSGGDLRVVGRRDQLGQHRNEHKRAAGYCQNLQVSRDPASHLGLLCRSPPP